LRNVLLDFRPNATDDRSSASPPIWIGRVRRLSRRTGGAERQRQHQRRPGPRRAAPGQQGFLLHLDPIFAKPWQYIQANARLTWKLDKEGFTLIAPYLKVLGEEGKIAGDFLIRLHFDHSQEDYMDLRVGLVDGDGRYTAKYLPEVLSPALDEWLRTAILKGAVDQVSSSTRAR
jgi:hypothetical protein